MRRVITGLLIFGLLTSACSEQEPLTGAEAQWCRVTQPAFRLIAEAEAMGIDLTEIISEAQRNAEAQEAVTNREDGLEAAFMTLEDDPGYAEVCRALYDDADRPFDREDELP